jgi:hypothetical protein
VIRPVSIVLLAALGGALAGAEPGETAPTIAPTPILTPQLPGNGSDATADPRLAAQRRLAELAADHGRRIAEIDAALGNATPAAVPAQEGLDAERRERDAALMRARIGAQDFVTKTRADTRDPLSAPAAAAPSTQNEGLAGGNRLAAADCYRQLVLDGQGGDADLAAGAEALSRIDAAQLPAPDLPRLLYLRVWFASEQARRAANPAERARLAAIAGEARLILLRDFPSSELTRTAQQLVRDLGGEEPR